MCGWGGGGGGGGGLIQRREIRLLESQVSCVPALKGRATLAMATSWGTLFHGELLCVSGPDTGFACLFGGCLTSQQHASVSQGRICSDNLACCHTEIEVCRSNFLPHPVTVY